MSLTRRACGCEYSSERRRVIQYCARHLPAVRREIMQRTAAALADHAVGRAAARVNGVTRVEYIAADVDDPRARARPKQLEKAEQAAGLKLLQSIGAMTWTLGSRRATRCRTCGALSTDMSTRQSPGLADVYAVLPMPRYSEPPRLTKTALWWEVKAPDRGRPSADQIAFRDAAIAAGVSHVLGPVDALFAFLIAGGWLKAEHVGAHHHRNPGTPEPWKPDHV